MLVFGRLSVVPVAILATSLACALPAATLAGGTTDAATAKASAAQPRPDASKKVWTNDDLIALGPRYQEATLQVPDVATSNQVPLIQDATVPAVQPIPANPPLDQTQDPRWYGDQMASFEAQLENIDAEAQRLREFRATSSAAPTGLVLDAPCDGITTDNLLQQLDVRRQQVLDQIDTLSDAARANGMDPGILVEGRGLVRTDVPLTADEQKAALINDIRANSEELAQTREVQAAMQARAAAQGITLLPSTPGEGGNMTTDLQQRLDTRADALQNEVDSAEGDARSAGIAPGELR